LEKANIDNQDNDELMRIRDQALRFKEEVTSWKNKLELANRRIKDLEDQSFVAKDCGHGEEMKKLKAQLQKVNALNEELNRNFASEH
jgi:hypothetical protein